MSDKVTEALRFFVVTGFTEILNQDWITCINITISITQVQNADLINVTIKLISFELRKMIQYYQANGKVKSEFSIIGMAKEIISISIA